MTKLFDEAEAVFCVWDDPTQTVGIRYLLVKGSDEAAAVQGDYGQLHIGVVPCLDEKLALATKEIFGD
jgi:hypothetical protein